jgi:hypothetical protein
MSGYEFKPMVEDDLPHVAAFLFEQQVITSREDQTQARPQGDDLQWMTRNPDYRPEMPFGETLRTADGKIAGMILAVPRLYRFGDKPLVGLAAGDFFVDAAARMQGFFMLRRYFKLRHGDFWFANSCNRQSGPLWAKCGAILVPESDVEYLYPFKLGPLAEELAIRKQWPRAVKNLLGSLGPGADIIASLRIPGNRFQVDYCADLEKLSELAAQCRNPELLQPERSMAHLKWQYGDLPEAPRDGQTKLIYTFNDRACVEGWFSLGFERRGREDQIRTARLMDAVWPEDRLSFTEILPAVIAAARPNVDLLSIRGRVGLKLNENAGGLKRRRLLAPEGFLLCSTPSTSELVGLADFPFMERY